MDRWRKGVSDYLAGLPHTGKSGFEGLVATLLSAATGQQFRIAGSGFQSGRDLDSEPALANSIAVEAKHYSAASLNRRELISELAEAKLNRPDLDLWVLACTRRVTTQLRDCLREQAADRDIELLIIDTGIDDLPRLPALMAKYRDAVRLWVQGTGKVFPTQLEASLAELQNEPQFVNAVQEILSQLNSTELGYDTARSAAARNLLHVLSDRGRTLRFFNQDLQVRAASLPVIHRAPLHNRLNEWWGSAKCSPRRAIVHGEEGAGKTWAVMDWVASRIQAGSMPLVLPFSASVFPRQRYDDIESAIPWLLSRWSERGTPERWAGRLRRWIRNCTGQRPLILVIVDGLNEAPDIRWAAFFRSLEDEEWNRAIAVLATDRTGHWKPNCEGAGLTAFLPIEVGDYTDPELEQALSGMGIPLHAIPPELQQLIRRPRYCELVARHYEEMVRDRDFTRERLLFLDMMHRHDTRPGYPLTCKEFEDVVRGLAVRYRDSGALGVSDLKDLWIADPDGRKYQEIIDGGLLNPVEGFGTRYTVEPTRLAFGLGLALADMIRRTAETTPDRASVEETIGRATEPHPDMDLKVRICESAIAHAFRDQGFPPVAKLALLRHWIGLRHWAEVAQSAFGAYVCRAPGEFIALAEEVWCSRDEGDARHEFLFEAIAENRDHHAVQAALIDAVGRWLSCLYADGHPYDRRPGKSRREIVERRVGHRLLPGNSQLCSMPVCVTEDDEWRKLTAYGLRLISAGPRHPFRKAIVSWAVASAAMDSDAHSDLVAWVLRLSDEDLEAPLIAEAERLFALGGTIADDAARTILWCLGTADARRLRSERPRPESASSRRDREDYAADPCLSWLPWTGEDCERCAERTDIDALTVVHRLGDRVFDPNYAISPALVERCIGALPRDPELMRCGLGWTEAESRFRGLLPVLASRVPSIPADLVRAVVRTLPKRGVDEQYPLALWLPSVSLLLTSKEIEIVLHLARQLRGTAHVSTPPGGGQAYRAEEIIEHDALLSLAPHLNGQELTEELLARPANAPDFTTLQLWFRPLPQPYARRLLDKLKSTAETAVLRRILWVLPAGKPDLNDEDRDRIVELAQSSDWGVRDTALRFACCIDDDHLGRRLLDLQRPTLREHPYWGAKLVVCHSGHLAFEVAAGMVQPDIASHLLEKRGNRPGEIRVYARSLDRWWRSTLSKANPVWPMPASSPLNSLGDSTAADLACAWSESPKRAFDPSGFNLSALRAIYHELPGMMQEWVAPVLNDSRMAQRLQVEMMTTLTDFCIVLLDVDPATGLRLWRSLAQSEWIRFPEAEVAFAARDNPETEGARHSVVSRSMNDFRLAEVASFAERNGRARWLNRTIAGLVSARPLWRRAQGLTLASLSDIDEECFEQLLQRASIADTWVEESIEWMRGKVRRNQASRYWYSVFLDANEPDRAWAAFQVFLERADRRFYTWRRRREEGMSVEDDRLRHARALKDEIDRAIKEQDRRLESTLFGFEIQRNRLVPFSSQ